MRSFWNEYCVAPWDNWSLGLFDKVVLCTPSQQCHESWHKQILQSRIPGMFKGSTEHVMHVALPKLVNMDAALISDELCFTMKHPPRRMYEKASWYLEHENDRIIASEDDAGTCSNRIY